MRLLSVHTYLRYLFGYVSVCTFYQFLQALPHDVNVVNVVELQGNIIVVVSALVPLTGSLICHGIDLGHHQNGAHVYRYIGY